MTDAISADLKHIADQCAKSADFHKGQFLVVLVSETGHAYTATNMGAEQIRDVLGGWVRTDENMCPTEETQ